MLSIKSTSIFILISMGMVLSSCEGSRCASGIIYGTDTNQPLNSVYCEVLTGSDQIYTDSSGSFSVCNNFGGCVPKCPDIEVQFSKKGYKTKTLTNPEFDSEVYLEKE